MPVWMQGHRLASFPQDRVVHQLKLEPFGLGWTDPKLETVAVTPEEARRIRHGRASPNMHGGTLPDTRDSGKHGERRTIMPIPAPCQTVREHRCTELLPTPDVELVRSIGLPDPPMNLI
jgi:hypothetical protein